MTNHPLSVVPKPESELAKVYLYHDRTKHRLDRYARSLGYLDWANQPNPFRRFDGAGLIPLPVPKIEAEPTYDTILAAEGSVDTRTSRSSLRSPRPSDLFACQFASETGRSWPGVYNNVRLARR